MSDDSAQQQGAEGRISAHIAHNARVWNYWLGGKDHYEVDEQVGDMVTSMYPSIGEVARADRAFLGRAVTYLAGEAGIRQYLDIGTGLPTVENTHEVAQRIAPDSRVVYVDNDPIVLTHARALLTSSTQGATSYVDADAHDPRAIVAAASETLDFDRPVAIMLLGILNFVLDTDKATAIVRELVEAIPSGSYVVLTHPTLELGGEGNEEAMKFWNENATPPITARTGAEVKAFLDGLEILEPGLVSCARWRTEGTEEGPLVAQFGVVARKP
ncbi:SAM-dependent methyltransferase [Streptomyces sp. VRA16 Mangrove soil]|uniref:SAM-dependent methyltransferase n=1 Tax=Streptomyces sp. VRA16 Mangrove soil TaxID=2817434 RepID=UPI001A9D665E|nr:SAM-dependent methyltransferase [Streptomyces sp. VRA16 Mangrove soil]MBO1332517.1 SAM-dependent methyltransferase [Streptomyces sp. VRA16 Mangrove soil]